MTNGGFVTRRAWALAAGLVIACGGMSDEDAVALVKRYNELNIEAFRSGDATLTEATTGLEEGKKLLGLIGVRLDQGLVLDARMLEFAPVAVERRDGAVFVTARERWYWLERRIGTGQQVGLDSVDRYVVRYRLGREEGRWVVLGKDFVEPPQVGRPPAAWQGSARDLHGLPPKPAPATGGTR